MTGLFGPRVAEAGRLDPRYLAVSIVTVGVVLVLLSDLAPEVRRATGAGALLLGGGTLAALCATRWRRLSGSPSRGWGLLALASIAAAFSNADVWLGEPPRLWGMASVGNVMLVITVLLAGSAVFCFPGHRRQERNLLRMCLEGIVLGGSILFVSSVTVFPQILRPGLEAGTGPYVAAAAAVIDVTVATVAALLAWRGRDRRRSVAALVAVAFGLFGTADFGAAVVATGAPFAFGSRIALGWVMGYAVLIIAVLQLGVWAGQPVQVRRLSSVAGTGLIFAVFLLSAAVGMPSLLAGRLSVPSVIVASVVLLAVVARQLILIFDHERLRRSLQQRVIERTASLRAVTAQTTLLVNSVGEGIYGVDAAGLVTFVNPAAAHALGRPAASLIGQDAHAAFHLPPDSDRPSVPASCYVTTAVQSRLVTSRAEDVYLRADGRTIPVEVTATPMSQDGHVRGAVVVFRDITARREMDRLKNESVSMVSHELRTPLTAIRGSLGLLSGGAFGRLDPQAARMVDVAVDSTDRLNRLVDDFLDIERIESGTLPIEVGVHIVEDLVGAAVTQLRVIAAASHVGVGVGQVDGWVRGDGDRVVQILLNLLSNAVKFSPRQSTVEVTTTVLGNEVEFCVRDRGRGVPPHKLDRLFTRFFQVDNSDARDKAGFGLGLPITQSLVDRMGGRIWAENNPGPGMAFRFRLPGGELASDRHLAPTATLAAVARSSAS